VISEEQVLKRHAGGNVSVARRKDGMTDDAPAGPAGTGPGRATGSGRPLPERLDEAECLRLISPGGVGRLAYVGRYGPTVLPVNYVVHEGAIVFRTAHDSPTDEDLRTGIADAAYKVAFEIDELDPPTREGWSVLVQGSLYHVESEAERASLTGPDGRRALGGWRKGAFPVYPSHAHHWPPRAVSFRTVRGRPGCLSDRWP
jgi:hypothetical protein